MRKAFFSFLILVISLCPIFAGNGMGVKMISKESNSTSNVSLDDLQLNVEVTIDGYGVLKATSFEIFDWLGYYSEGKNRPDPVNWYSSGTDADFAMLKMDITNLMKTSKDFLANAKVKVIFDDDYEFEGWCYQFNHNNASDYYSPWYISDQVDKGKQNKTWVISPKDNFEINMLYTGHYVFGCTLPNYVIASTLPLRIEITMDGNLITYNIRK